MRRKGVNALELVFSMFILIVVTLVVIRLISTYLKKETLPPLDDFRKAYNYDKEVGRCESLCSSYSDSGGSKSAAVIYCQEKVKIDINGNYIIYEKRTPGIIAGIPYCEDGLYCFHIDEKCQLSSRICLSIMQEYYMDMEIPEKTANELILKRISYGTCEPDPFKWKGRKLSDGTEYIPQKLEDGSVIGADYWWKVSGYGNLKTETPTATTTATKPSEQLSLSNCKLDKSTEIWGFSCDTNCVKSGPVVVFDKNYLSSTDITPTAGNGKLTSQPSIKNTLNDLKCPDTWNVILTCEEPNAEKTSAFSCS
jgi:hypothetical protein